jgi:superfamily II DNA or RNA helicase
MIEKLVITLIKHPHWGDMLQPALVREEISGALSILEIVGQTSSFFPHLNDSSKSVVKLAEKLSDKALMKIFSKEKSVADFHKTITPERIEKYIRPYIENVHRKIIALLIDSQLPLYIRDGVRTRGLYDTDRVMVSGALSHAVFHFKKNRETGLHYLIRLKCQDEEIDLHSTSYFVLCSAPAMLVVNRKLYVFNDIDIKKLLPFFSKKQIDVPAASEKTYIKKFVRSCLEKYEVNAEGIDIQHIDPKKKAILVLESDWNMVPALFLNFSYGDNRYPMDAPDRKIVFDEERDGETGLSWFYPDKTWEKSLIDLLLENGLQRSGVNHFAIMKVQGDDTFENIASMVEWLREHVDLLKHFEFSQNIPDKSYFLGEMSIQTLEMETKQDWFDMKVEALFGEFRIPFIRFRHHILNDIHEYILPDGSIAILPQDWFSRYYELMLFSHKSDTHVRLKKYHYRLIDSLVDKKTALFPFLNGIPEVPPQLQATLRPYQQDGFLWLVHLFENHFGGCLADDMGLGKTIQTIALLQYIADLHSKSISSDAGAFPLAAKIPHTTDNIVQLSMFSEVNTKATSLIVMPTSLIHNWQNELKRFAPNLKVYVYAGAKRLKTLDIQNVFRFYDVVLTTYGTLRVDIDFLQLCDFHHFILDESQFVKNPDSLSYKAVKQINARYKVALTGTPIENSLGDLWTQLHIVNEGLLGSYSSFRNAYINPINKNNKEKEEALLRMIQPFILRRTKEEVAPELPALSDETVYCDMSEEQQARYNIEKNRLRNSLLESEMVLQPRRMALIALQGLTRLRLLASHPILMDAAYDGDSGKFEQIVMRFETLKAENHKVLVFSSFVKHLRILANHFDRQQWKYAWLTGVTAATNREAEINKFMTESDVHCFFISLKAGGVGLNLTAADYVFIIDPWWNPAAEWQAISRAHRIGQDKNVMVSRFISSETIEEKIRNLQEAKSKLADMFITSNNPIAKLNQEEILGLLGTMDN